MRPFRKRSWHDVRALLCSKSFWILLFFLVAITQMLSRSPLVDGLRGAGLDMVLSLARPSISSSNILLVEIDDNDYVNHFNAKLPLDDDRFNELLHAIAKGRPLLTVVDIEYSKLPSFQDKGLPIVWACGAVDSKNAQPSRCESIPHGVPTLPKGQGGKVRGYRYWVRSTGGFSQTLVAAAVEAACDSEPKRWPEGCKQFRSDVRNTNERFISFAGAGPPKLPASKVLQLGKAEQWSNNPLINGRIVILGANLPQSRDLLDTPIGSLSGGEVIARAIATALDGVGMRTPGLGQLLAGKVIAGVLMGILAALLVSRASVFLHLVIVPIGAVAAAWFFAASTNYWIDFVPVLMSGFIHQWYHDLSEHNASSLADVKVTSARPA